MYVDHITKQTFNYATPIDCGNIIELDPDTDYGDFYVLRPDPLKSEAHFLKDFNSCYITNPPKLKTT